MSQEEGSVGQNTPDDVIVDEPRAAADQSPRSVKLGVTVFPLFIIGGAAAALITPAAFTPFAPMVSYALMVIMFGMGLTLTLPDFALVIRRPVPVVVGVVFQYLAMPLLAFGLAIAMQLPSALAAGLILVGCVPGGTASNVVTYLARGDVALSVTMTSVSTLISPLLTPVLMLLLAGRFLPVPAAEMAWSIMQIVFIPVVTGLVLRLLLPRLVRSLQPALPWISILTITFVLAVVVAGSRDVITSAGLLLVVAIALHNGLGYAVGYFAGVITRAGIPVRRAIAIEVGTQNSALAATLATRYLSPEAALPGAVCAVWHNVTGGLLASFWGRRSTVGPGSPSTRDIPDAAHRRTGVRDQNDPAVI